MFFLAKRDDTWTLSYEVGPLRRAVLIGCGVAGLAIPAYLSIRTGAFDRSALAATVGVVVALVLVAYWTLSDAASSAVFDLAQRRVTLHRRRPWFGPPRSYPFSDVARLSAV